MCFLSGSRALRQAVLLLDVVILKVRKSIGNSALFILCCKLPLREFLRLKVQRNCN